MAYTKTVWETGDVITAAKLNNAEDGIEAASAAVTVVEYEEDAAGAEVKMKLGDIFAAAKKGLVVFYCDQSESESSKYFTQYVFSSASYDARDAWWTVVFSSMNGSGANPYSFTAADLDTNPTVIF